jgi:hypothetical protein
MGLEKFGKCWCDILIGMLGPGRYLAPACNCGTIDSMKRKTVVPKKKRGPPATGKGTQIQVRLQPDDLDAVDAWRDEQDGEPTRPEAIRSLLRQALKRK